MGVSGAGKSTVGAALAELLKIGFVDADSLHPGANIAKMAAGQPLTDADRAPWLDLVGSALRDAPSEGLVVACSALKRSYRDAIRTVARGTVFVHLAVPRKALAKRVARRRAHFMPSALLGSQLEALEPLQADEAGWTVPAVGGVEATASTIMGLLGSH